LVFSSSNAGFSGAVNAAVQAARSLCPRYYLLLNNDARPHPGAIPALLDVANEVDADVVGATTVDSTGVVLFDGRPFPGELFGLVRERAKSTSRGWHETGRVDGAAMLIRSSVVEQRLDEDGWLLDPAFFLYWEDVDLCAYVRSKGGRCVIASSAKVMHTVAASSGGAFNPRGTYYQTRNRVFMSRRWLPHRSWLLFDSFFLASRLTLQVLRTPFGRARWRAVLHGLMDGYRGRGGPSRIAW
jgi:GT2 family glycosyltransferase